MTKQGKAPFLKWQLCEVQSPAKILAWQLVLLVSPAWDCLIYLCGKRIAIQSQNKAPSATRTDENMQSSMCCNGCPKNSSRLCPMPSPAASSLLASVSSTGIVVLVIARYVRLRTSIYFSTREWLCIQYWFPAQSDLKSNRIECQKEPGIVEEKHTWLHFTSPRFNLN